MRITQTYITPQDQSSDALTRSKYQMLCNYLSLPISAWIAGKKLDLGKFNRIVFEEGSQEDFAVVGNNALVVGIAKEFTSFEELQSQEQVHSYFVRKYLEGFGRFDQHYGLQLAVELGNFLGSYFADEYAYQKKLASRVVRGAKYDVYGKYTCDSYSLIVVLSAKDLGVIRKETIHSAPPDPFVIRYDVHSVKFETAGIRVLSATGNETAFFPFPSP
jgi:hypothetical protein